MRTVFVDTVGLLAIWDEDDQWHVAADSASRLLASGRVRLVTTTLVLYECGNAAARRPYRNEVAGFRDELLRLGDLIEPSAEDVDQAWRDYGSEMSGGAGVVDQVSFVVMRRLGLREVFTNDKHFAAAGFQVLF